MSVPHVLVVLGHRLNEGGTASSLLVTRVRHAARFFRLHQTCNKKASFGLVVLSGGVTRPGQVSEAVVMKDNLPRGIIPSDLVVCETESRTTLENVRNAIRIAEERFPGQQIAFMFVTQSWHYPQVTLHFGACLGDPERTEHFLAHPPLPVPGELPLAESLLRFLVLVYTYADRRHWLLNRIRQAGRWISLFSDRAADPTAA